MVYTSWTAVLAQRPENVESMEVVEVAQRLLRAVATFGAARTDE
jgi:hypothetical protein